jgi:hypothetical protein
MPGGVVEAVVAMTAVSPEPVVKPVVPGVAVEAVVAMPAVNPEPVVKPVVPGVAVEAVVAMPVVNPVVAAPVDPIVPGAPVVPVVGSEHICSEAPFTVVPAKTAEPAQFLLASQFR